jgi:signal transduction histidine kinase
MHRRNSNSLHTMQSTEQQPELNAHRLLIRFNWTAFAFSVVYMGVSWAIGFAPGVYLMAANGLAMLGNLAYFHHQRNYLASANIYLFANCFIAILGSSYYSGGLYSPAVPWFSTGPVTAILLLGLNRTTAVWTLINTLCVLAFGAAEFAGIALPVFYAAHHSGVLFASSLVGMVFTFLIHTKIFEDAKSQALTEARQSNIELRLAKERVESAYLAKSRFLAAASHDLRQPAHAMGMFVARLSQLPKDQANDELVAGVDASVRALQDMLEVFFDYSRLEAHAEDIRIVPVSVQDLFEQMRTAFMPIAIQKGLRFRVRGSRDWVLSDTVLLQRILLNLIGNALQYTAHGTILVSCRTERALGHARIEVWDSGIGIAPQHHESIFEEFFQVQNPERDRQKGLGLGLSMVDRACRLLKHRLSLRSALGCGSRFTVTVPLARRRAADLIDPPGLDWLVPTGAMTMRVLLVEDDALGRSAMAGLLQSWGCHVTAVSDGQEALATVSPETQFDFIVSDFRLRGQRNGAQTIQALREALGQTVPACLVSGDIEANVQGLALAAGLILLPKPVKPAKLRSVLRQSALQ